jgi:hypothetical protein
VFAAVEFVTARKVFAVQELPDCLDPEGKMTLVRRLLKEGLLQRRAAAGRGLGGLRPGLRL